MSLAKLLLDKVQSEGRVSYAALCQYTLEEGYKIETMGRRLREHAEDGLIHPVFSRSKRNTEYISAYTAKPAENVVARTPQIVMKDGIPVVIFE